MPKAGITIKERDFGWNHLKQAVLKLDARGGAYVRVGVQGAQAAANVQHTQLTYVQLAKIHEFGVPGRIPERSFLRATIQEHQVDIQKRASLCGRGVALGKLTIEFALELLGEYAVGLIKQRIADGIPPPNAPSTILRKGSSKPLIDTGGLRASITHRPERA